MHFTGELAAASCDQPGKEYMAELVGAKHDYEISILNGLTVNMNMLMLAFYKPLGKRRKILFEAHAFPSDRVRIDFHNRQNIRVFKYTVLTFSHSKPTV